MRVVAAAMTSRLRKVEVVAMLKSSESIIRRRGGRRASVAGTASGENAVKTRRDPPPPPPWWLAPRWVLALSALARLLAAPLTRTYAAPDELWQGPEVAHGLAFGARAWRRTWEWAPPPAGAALRSHAHPALLAAAAYAPVHALEAALEAWGGGAGAGGGGNGGSGNGGSGSGGSGSGGSGSGGGIGGAAAERLATGLVLPLLWLAPRLVHALAAAAGDAATFLLARRLFGCAAARWALALQLCSHFALFAAARPFSSGLEAALQAAAALAWRAALDEALGVGGGGCGDGAPGRSGGAGGGVGIAIAPPVAGRGGLGAAAAAGLLAGLAFVVRPTSALLWACLAPAAVAQVGLGAAWRLAWRAALPAALAAAALASALDRWLYGAWVLPCLRFFFFNAAGGGGDALYGAYPPLWYLYNGLPAVAGLQLPLLLHAAWALFGAGAGAGAGEGEGAGILGAEGKANGEGEAEGEGEDEDAGEPAALARRLPAAARWWRARELALAAAGVVAALSLASAHKEHRFLLPLVPVLSALGGRSAAALWARLGAPPPGAGAGAGTGTRARARLRASAVAPAPLPWRARAAAGALAAAAALSLGAGLFLNLVHQRGPVAAAEALARDAARARFRLLPALALTPAGPETLLPPPLPLRALMQAHALAPCHALPFFAVVHYEVQLLGLDCSPAARLPMEATTGGGGGGGGRLREGACARGGPACCGGAAPALSESDAWQRAPARLLRALYGDAAGLGAPRARPRLCALLAGPAAAAAAEAAEPFAEEEAALGGDEVAAQPEAFALEFGAEACRARLREMREKEEKEEVEAGTGTEARARARPRAVRRLPTHVVMFDTDAARPDVAAWLAAANFSLPAGRAFAHSPLSGDAHAAGPEPREVRVYAHECWLAATAAL